MDMIMNNEQLMSLFDERVIPMGLSLLAALVVFIVGKWVAGALTNLIERLMLKRLDPMVAGFLANMIRVLFLAVVVVAALDQLGVETTSIIAILGAAGLAVGLALKDSLGNLAAGVMLVIFRPFTVGHFVEAAGVSGNVKKISIFNTLLTTPDNKQIVVPNGAIMGGNIINYSAMPVRRVDMKFGVSYSADLSEVKKVLESVIAQDERVLSDPAPVIAVAELADSSVNLHVRPWVNSENYWVVLWDTTERVKKAFDEAGISIPFPQMDVHMTRQEAAGE